MRHFIILFLVCLLFAPLRCEALLQKKDFSQIFLNGATSTKKRKDKNPAFHSYENLLKHKADIAAAQNNYTKALEITEQNLQKNPEDISLLNLALEYSIAGKNWDKALIYTNKLLEFTPDNEKLLKNQGDLYTIKENFPKAITAYEKLVEIHPGLNYQITLADLYMANQDFAKAQQIYETAYNVCPDCPEFVEAYLNALLAQNKLVQAYWLIKKHRLENTKSGYMISGDMAMKDEDYKTAAKNYSYAANLEPENIVLQLKLADSYRMSGYINGPEKIFKKILEKEPDNIDAQLGLGYLEIEKKNYDRARRIFLDILKKHPDCRHANIAIAHSYDANNYKMSALDILTKIPAGEDSQILKAQIYYDINMKDEAKNKLDKNSTKEAQELKYKIRRDNAIIIAPFYSLLNQKLADEFNLDYQKYGVQISKNIKKNTNVFFDYNVIWYMSGSPYFLYDVVNEFRTGAQGRPDNKWEYRADIGVKVYQRDGSMLNTDSWLKYHFSDKFNLKFGYVRNNVEQSYLSAVGNTIDGIFTGRSAYNKVYTAWEGKLPKHFYYFGNAGYGLIVSANLTSNQYFEGLAGIGKVLYDNPENKWVNKFTADIVSYNSAYQYNQLEFYSRTGRLFGGYFSPSYFNATTCHLALQGEIKKWRLKYGLQGFGGVQNALGPDQTTPTWSYSANISYDINDYISVNALYKHFNYADIQRDLFMFGAIIRKF